MNIFNDPIMITLRDSDPFVSVVTFDPMHGKSQNFYLTKASLLNSLGDHAEGSITEGDLLNYCSVSHSGNNVRFKVSWLHNAPDNGLCGYQQTFLIPVDLVVKVLAGETVKYLSVSPRYREKAHIFFTKTAREVIAAASQDKLKRHALRKFLRDHFNYGKEERLVVMEDKWINGFYFFSSVSKYEGGIALHETEITGRDGKKHRKVYFGLHT